MCAGIGAISFTATAVQQYGFGVVGQRLTRRLRVLLYAAIMRQVCYAAAARCFTHHMLA